MSDKLMNYTILQMAVCLSFGIYAGVMWERPFRKVKYWVILLSLSFGPQIIGTLL